MSPVSVTPCHVARPVKSVTKCHHLHESAGLSHHLLVCPAALQRIQEMATARITAGAAGAALDEASQLDLLDQTLNRVLVMRVDTPEALKANLNQLAQMVGDLHTTKAFCFNLLAPSDLL